MKEEEVEYGYDSFSRSQLITLVSVAAVTGFLSILGSLGIITMLYLRGDKKRLYHRILFAMSSVDIIFSAQAMVGPLPIPKESGYPGAIGNATTCTMAGFMMHMGGSAFLYNCWLMFTFLSIVRYGQKEVDIAQKYEKYIHISCLLVPFLEGIVITTTRSFNTTPNYPRCYISAAPAGCDVLDDVECSHGQHSILLFFIFVGLKFLLLVPFLFVAVSLIWWTVRQNDRQSSQVFTHNIRNINQVVAHQSILYGVVFFNTYFWVMVEPVLDLTVGPSAGGQMIRFIIRLLSLIFFPLQGFLNFFIFSKPRYTQIRNIRTDRSIFWAMKEAVFGYHMEHSRYSIQATLRTGHDGNTTRSQMSGMSFRSPALLRRAALPHPHPCSLSSQQSSDKSTHSNPQNLESCSVNMDFFPGEQSDIVVHESAGSIDSTTSRMEDEEEEVEMEHNNQEEEQQQEEENNQAKVSESKDDKATA